MKIGTQTWMAENLNYDAEGSKCYENEPENCAKYGRLYDWSTAKMVCPKGWHLPTNKEWDALYRYADGANGTESPYESETAGKLLKAKEGWNDGNGKSGSGTDSFGFAALPGGRGYGGWWSASEYDSNYAYGRIIDSSSRAYYRSMSFYDEGADWGSDDKTDVYSVRCLQD